MAYEQKTWVSGVTPCSAENFNHMEEGIAAAHEAISEQNTKIKPMVNVPYIKIKSVVATDKLTFGCAVRSDGAGGTRQVVLVLGSANGVPIHGILHIRSATTAVTWDGNNGVVSASLSGNTVTAVLKQAAYDYILLISSAEIS